MKTEIIYWTTKDGNKINIDEMSIEHLRNTLKLIVSKNQSIKKTHPYNSIVPFSDKEIDKLLNKTKYQFENEENLWK
jgi:hypothetical protein